ncbi:hypothetical protein FOVG_19309 [Fusarium oxysporum f. sp. pisi HDV247]|uniref:Uncharacterized protein n=1 Tax=Fusarium oxysporum f. sp. pisi HDV247 TaxID=1080344 RepID=W9NMQ5_FUSOX|nr:hypothetical protein FOVG_19309 [Fusarium oxysporum f. sp. pisi HDV247]
MTPAGHFHLALMFGPLIFESGVPKTRHGVLITPRPQPTLFSSTAEAEALVDEVQDDPLGLFADCAIFYQDKESMTRGFYREHRRVSSRSTLACLKRVYGGSFSGYPASANLKEAAVIHCLIREAPKCKSSSKRVSAQREQLHRSAGELIVHIRQLLGAEVEKYLRRIAKLLMDSRMKISWNMWRDNCQRLVNRLLGGKDFEYVFPRLPPNFGSRTQDGDAGQFRWPRYLISFGGHIEGFGISLDQPNSVLTNFSQNKKIDYDIMEYLIVAHSKLSKSLAQLALIDSNTEAGHAAVLEANALWELPLDTLSLLQFHFTLPPHKYFDKSGKPLTHKQWIDNRLSLLRLLDIFASLTGGLGVALLSMFTRKPNLISKVTIPKSLVFGAARADDVIRTLRISPLTTIYLLSRRGDKGAPSILNDEAAKWEEELETKLSMLFQKFSQQRALKACIAFATIYVHRVNKARKGLTGMPLLPLLLLPQTIQHSIMSWKQYEGGWFTFEVGDIMFAQQVLRKTKNIRK